MEREQATCCRARSWGGREEGKGASDAQVRFTIFYTRENELIVHLCVCSINATVLGTKPSKDKNGSADKENGGEEDGEEEDLKAAAEEAIEENGSD